MIRKLIFGILVMSFIFACQDNGEQSENGNTTSENSDGKVVSYQCEGIPITIVYKGETVQLSYTNEENKEVNLNLERKQTLKGDLWMNGDYAVTSYEGNLKISRPNMPSLKCRIGGDLQIEVPQSQDLKKNINDWQELTNKIDEFLKYDKGIPIYQDINSTNKNLEPVKVWFQNDKPLKIYIPSTSNISLGIGEYYYYHNGILAYARTPESHMLFDENGRLIHWFDKDLNKFDLDHTVLQQKEAAKREDLSRFIKMAKTFR